MDYLEQRLSIATQILLQMLSTGGTKENEVVAAFEYADLLLANHRNYVQREIDERLKRLHDMDTAFFGKGSK